MRQNINKIQSNIFTSNLISKLSGANFVSICIKQGEIRIRQDLPLLPIPPPIHTEIHRSLQNASDSPFTMSLLKLRASLDAHVLPRPRSFFIHPIICGMQNSIYSLPFPPRFRQSSNWRQRVEGMIFDRPLSFRHQSCGN